MSTCWESVFSFGDPKSIPNNKTLPEDERGQVREIKKLRVIVVDDEELIAETVVEILKHEGFEAAAVSNGFSAIEMAKTWAPDIVLSDVILSGLNGIETGIKIREIAP